MKIIRNVLTTVAISTALIGVSNAANATPVSTMRYGAPNLSLTAKAGLTPSIEIDNYTPYSDTVCASSSWLAPECMTLPPYGGPAVYIVNPCPYNPPNYPGTSITVTNPVTGDVLYYNPNTVPGAIIPIYNFNKK